MGLSLESRVVADGQVLSADVGGETVLMDAVSGSYFTFESVGTQIWQALATPVQVGAVCATLVAEYDAPEEQIRENVLSFLEDLLARGLIKAV